jgi:sulfite reductase (NADPH) flavoprotein alpha-component
MQQPSLWYFAYGSNLDPGTFLGRRRMRPSDTRRALLSGYRLVFDLPVGRGERAVANLAPDPGARVHGVAYAISRLGAIWLDRTEGVPLSYRRVPVPLLDDEGERLPGFTYVSERRRPGCMPSERYMNLLLRGAHHHGLPDDYLAWLRAIELARDERKTQLELDLRPPAEP